MEGAALGAAAVNVAGFQHCHQGDVEQCIGKYGSGKAIVSIGAVLTIGIMPLITEECWKGQDEGVPFVFRHCGLMSGITSGVEFGFGVQQFTAYQKRRENEKDTTSLAFRLRH